MDLGGLLLTPEKNGEFKGFREDTATQVPVLTTHPTNGEASAASSGTLGQRHSEQQHLLVISAQLTELKTLVDSKAKLLKDHSKILRTFVAQQQQQLLTVAHLVKGVLDASIMQVGALDKYAADLDSAIELSAAEWQARSDALSQELWR